MKELQSNFSSQAEKEYFKERLSLYKIEVARGLGLNKAMPEISESICNKIVTEISETILGVKDQLPIMPLPSVSVMERGGIIEDKNGKIHTIMAISTVSDEHLNGLISYSKPYLNARAKKLMGEKVESYVYNSFSLTRITAHECWHLYCFQVFKEYSSIARIKDITNLLFSVGDSEEEAANSFARKYEKAHESGKTNSIIQFLRKNF